MNLVSNFVGSISPSMFGNTAQGISPSINLDDNTFSDLLEEQLNKKIEQTTNYVDSLGLPTGFNIEDLVNHNSNTVNTENKFENTDLQSDKNPKDLSTSEVLTFFNSLFESKPTLTDNINSGLFEFELKSAANQYSKYAKNIVTDLSEFVTDTLKKL